MHLPLQNPKYASDVNMPSQTKWRNVGWKTSTFFIQRLQMFFFIFVTFFYVFNVFLIFFFWNVFYIYGSQGSTVSHEGMHSSQCFSQCFSLKNNQFTFLCKKSAHKHQHKTPQIPENMNTNDYNHYWFSISWHTAVQTSKWTVSANLTCRWPKSEYLLFIMTKNVKTTYWSVRFCSEFIIRLCSWTCS